MFKLDIINKTETEYVHVHAYMEDTDKRKNVFFAWKWIDGGYICFPARDGGWFAMKK